MPERKLPEFGQLLLSALTWFNRGKAGAPKNDVLTELSEDDVYAELEVPGSFAKYNLH